MKKATYSGIVIISGVIILTIMILFSNISFTGYDVKDQPTSLQSLYQKLADNAKKEHDVFNQMAEAASERQEIMKQLAAQPTVTPTIKTETCTDTDITDKTTDKNYPISAYNYRNINIKGTATGYNPVTAKKESITDSCSTYSSNSVIEAYCNKVENAMYTNLIPCPNETTCKDGACIPNK